ncbi:hypothetical protein [Streptomyces sp. AC558_RSS880]|uniref:hypothetical protein n=1 Tax=Streptomyces sp. AC558_RSS880 TaxID=2823687 RepID=UPI0020B7A659|nr:hypothetical protein [Streptomyces sp. AC558_RSS880]
MNDRPTRPAGPLLLLPPGRGRHRTASAPVPRRIAPGVEVQAAGRAGTRYLRGEDDALVHPCVLAHEGREEARRQRTRRRASWLAVHGVDIGPRAIDAGPRTVDAGPRTVDAGPRTVDAGPRTVDAGARVTDAGPWTTDAGPWTNDAGPRTVDAGARVTDAGPWTTDAGSRTIHGVEVTA